MNIKVCSNPDCGNEFEAIPANKKFCSITCKRKNESRRLDTYSAEDAMESFYDDIFALQDQDPDKDLIERNTFLRKENTRLANMAKKYQHISEEIWDSVLVAIKDNARQITVKPPKQINYKKIKRDLVFNPWNSDTQLGKRTPTYNSQVAMDRVEQYTDKILGHYEDFKQLYPIRRAHVYFLGDIVEGEGIFPTQPHVIDSSVFEQAVQNGPSIYASQLRRLLEVFDTVHVTCVIGNHGQLSKFYNPESNMDRVLYWTLKWIFANEPRITFDIPSGYGESMFWAVDTIGEYSTLLLHGDQFPAPGSTAQYWRKILGWKTGGLPVSFDDVAMGHWHQNTKFTLGRTVVRIAGSTESYNTFAQERLGVMGDPSQHLQIVDSASGVFWESDIFLD